MLYFFKSASIIGKVFDYKFFFINGRWYIYLFSGTHIHGQERPKLRLNRTVTEVGRDQTETETETWTEWCAKNQPWPGLPNPTHNG